MSQFEKLNLNSGQKENFAHEIFHESTRADVGLSNGSREIEDKKIGKKILIGGLAAASVLGGLSNEAKAQEFSGTGKIMDLSSMEGLSAKLDSLLKTVKVLNDFCKKAYNNELNPENYRIGESLRTDSSKFFSDVFLQKFCENKYFVDSLRVRDLDSIGNLYSDHSQEEYRKKVSELTDFQDSPEYPEYVKSEARKRMSSLIYLIDSVKIELIHHIASEEYLNKLTQEVGDKEKAEENQKVRMQNVMNLNYDFKSSGELSAEGAVAYFDKISRILFLPYNDFFISKDELKQAIKHEIGHGSTIAELGLTKGVKKVFENSFQSVETDSLFYNGTKKELDRYFSDPSELIVRKQILDLWLEDMGIKKYGEKFTDEHYKKLLDMRKKGALPQNVMELFDHIKPEEFSKIMNDLAENASKKNYYSPDWNYDNNVNIS